MRKLFSLLAVAALALGFAAPSFAEDKKPEKKPEKKPAASPADRFKALDKDSDGSLTETEFLGRRTGEAATKGKEQFTKKDANKDGKLSLEEFSAAPKKKKDK